MVDILLKWSELMTKLKKSLLKIKLEEAAIAHRQNVVRRCSSASFCSYLIQKLQRWKTHIRTTHSLALSLKTIVQKLHYTN
jgi:hypothetical protein